MTQFDHLVRIDVGGRRLVIYRVYRNGRQEMYTSVDLPKPGDAEAARSFALQLGENLLFDSPTGRKLLEL